MFDITNLDNKLIPFLKSKYKFIIILFTSIFDNKLILSFSMILFNSKKQPFTFKFSSINFIWYSHIFISFSSIKISKASK